MRHFANNDGINNLIDGAMDKIKSIVDTSTVVGQEVKTEDGTTIIPILRVSVGYVVGGGEYSDLSSRRVANRYPMAGGSSGGMSMSPVGFLVISKEDVTFVNVENKSLYQTLLNMFNNIIEKVETKEGEKNEEK